MTKFYVEIDSSELPDNTDTELIGAWLNKDTEGSALDYLSLNNGVLSNITWRDSKAIFNGTSSKIVIGNMVSDVPFSIIGWAKCDNVQTNNCVFGFADSASNNSKYGIYFSSTDNKIICMYNNIVDIEIENGYTPGNWINIALVCESNSSRKLYIDGVLSGSSTDTISFSGADNFSIGVFNSLLPTYFFSGEIRDIRIYNNIKSSEYIYNLFLQNNISINRVKEFVTKKNITNLSGNFSLVISDPTNTLFNKITSGDEVRAYRSEDDLKLFGGYIEDISRNQKRSFELKINGGDYTTKLNQLFINSQNYFNREHGVVVRNLMHLYLMSDTLFDDCESINNWSVSNDLGNLALQEGNDTNGYLYARLGTACIEAELTYSDGYGSLIKNSLIDYNLKITDFIDFYFYSDDKNIIDKIELYIGQDISNCYKITNTQELETGWNYLEFDLLDAELIGSGTLTGVNYFEIKIYSETASGNKILIDDVRIIPGNSTSFKTSKVETTNYYSSISLKNVSLFEAIKKIAEIRAKQFDFYVDNDKVLNFGIYGQLDSGVEIQRGVNLLNAEFFEDDASLINSVIVYGGRQVFTWQETFSGTGDSDYVLTYEPVDAFVTVNGSEKLGYQEGMATSDYDYKIKQQERKIVFNSGKEPTAGQNIVVNYSYSVPIIVKNENPESIKNYGKREKKIENPQLINKSDALTVAKEYIKNWSYPITNGEVEILINPAIDVGELVSVTESKYFPGKINFVVAAIENTLVGSRLKTRLTLTSTRQNIEEYLKELYERLNALEEKEKGSSELVAELINFLDSLDLSDNPTDNLIIKDLAINDSMIWGHPTPVNGYWGTAKWGDRRGTYGDNLVENASD